MRNTGIVFHLILMVLLFPLCVMSSPLAMKELTLSSVVDGEEFRVRRPLQMRSLRDGIHYTTLSGSGEVLRWRYRDGVCVDTLFSPRGHKGVLGEARVDGYEVTGRHGLLLLTTGRKRIYRRSFSAVYYLYDTQKERLWPLTERGRVQNAVVAPDGSKASYVYENNIYIVDLVSGAETAVTRDGVRNRVINGVADWVYEEEFALTECCVWSDDSKHLAFMRFDESGVKVFSMPYYGEGLYTGEYAYKYPKAGEANSEVSVHLYEVSAGTSRRVDLGYPQDFTDYYVPRISWVAGRGLNVITLDRLQRQVRMLLYEPESGTSRPIYEEKEEQYISEIPTWYGQFLSDGERFIVASERDGYYHLYLETTGGGRRVQLTSGEDEVVDFYGVDEVQGRVYYSAYDGSPLRTAIFSVNLRGKSKRRHSFKPGWNQAQFSYDFSYYTLWHQSLTSPLRVDMCRTGEGKPLREVEGNASLRERLAGYRLPRTEFFTVRTPDGVDLNGYRILPPDFDSTSRYPVLLFQYSGPNSQQVVDRFSIRWEHYLASRGCVVVCVDGRGTGGRGEDFRKCTYGRLGDLESRDQIFVGEWLRDQAWVDGSRIGIWGWSYGGYMSSLCLMRAPDVFSMAIAVAPVTNWRLYDTIYTERYMGLPQENGSGYDDHSPLHNTAGLKGRLLLVHGTFDDNVHFQHSMQLAEKLVRQGTFFEMAVYPDQDHFMGRRGAYRHLYERLQEFTERQFSL